MPEIFEENRKVLFENLSLTCKSSEITGAYSVGGWESDVGIRIIQKSW